MAARPLIREVWKEHGHDFATGSAPLVFDVLRSIQIFAGFAAFAWVLGLARAWGFLEEEELRAYARAHFWGNYVLFIVTMLRFLWGVLFLHKQNI